MSTEAKTHRPGPSMQVGEGDDLLRTIALLRTCNPISVSDISEELSVTPQTALRLASTLHFHGFLMRSAEPGNYVPGPVLAELGLAIAQKLDLRVQVRSFLEELSRKVGETVHLMTLDGRDVVFVDSVESTRMLRVAGRAGQRLPAHATAGGKALLAALDSRELRSTLGKRVLRAMTASSITTFEALWKELAEIRRQGIAMNRGESEEDVAAMAMVVRDRTGRTRGAISVSAPASRFDPVAQEAIEDALRQCVSLVEPRI